MWRAARTGSGARSGAAAAAAAATASWGVAGERHYDQGQWRGLGGKEDGGGAVVAPKRICWEGGEQGGVTRWGKEDISGQLGAPVVVLATQLEVAQHNGDLCTSDHLQAGARREIGKLSD